MKAIILSFIMALGALTAQAQSYNYLTLQQSDGTEQSVSVSGLKITFSDSEVIATNGTATVSVPLAQMSKMYFSQKATAITDAAAAEAVSAAIVGGKLQVSAPVGTEVQVFSVDGRRLSPDGTFSKGVYVVRAGGKSFKLLAQ